MSDRTPYRSGDSDLPLVWVLQGHRTGDNLQVQALADGLGWPWEGKSLTWQKTWLRRLPQWTPFYGRSSSLRHLTSQAKEKICPPWPDLVLSVGWRSVPIARWIKDHCDARLVHLGRPRAPLSAFDLVLTTPQYRLPATQNVVHLAGPLTTLSSETVAAALDAWGPRIARLPRPWIAVLVGGDTPTSTFPPSAASALAQAANDLAASVQGSLLVVTSPRTPDPVAKALRDALPAQTFFHQWHKDADTPYAAFLAMADQFIVTDDSISMTHEAALSGQPLYLFPLTPRKQLPERTLLALDNKLRGAGPVMARAYLGLIRQGLVYPPKSPADYFDQLLHDGRACILGNQVHSGKTALVQPENDRAIKAVQALFGHKTSQTAKKS